MMLRVFQYIEDFFSWWVQTLLSCLPEKWSAYLQSNKGKFGLVIVHQGDSILLMDDQGKLLDSVAGSGTSIIDLENLPTEAPIVGDFSNTQLRAAEKLASGQDPPLSVSPNSLDLDLSDRNGDFAVETVDIPLGVDIANKDSRTHAPKLFGHDEANNVFSLNSPRTDDTVLVLEDQDQTTRFLESSQDGDTVIIKGNQGGLLQFDSGATEIGATEIKDSTVMFRNFGGKIKQVIPDAHDSRVSTDATHNQGSAIDDLVADVELADYAAVSKIIKAHQGKNKCLYLLPESRVLLLNLSYPIEAIQDIESVLKYDLEKHIPLSKQDIRYFYALNVDVVGEKVEAEVAVIKADEYDSLNLVLAPFLKTGLLCTTGGFFKKYGARINFLEEDSEKGWSSFFKTSSLHFGFNWLLLVFLLATPYLTYFHGLDTIEEKSQSEIRRVSELVSEFNSITAESNYGSLLAEQVNNTPRSIELLSVLSRNINAQAWLTRYSYNDLVIKIRGEAESATSVSDDLGRTGLFGSIKFVSAIVKNPKSGKETFELLLKLKSDA